MNTRLKIKDDLIDQVLGNKSLFKGNQIMIFSKPYIAEIIYNSLKKERQNHYSLLDLLFYFIFCPIKLVI